MIHSNVILVSTAALMMGAGVMVGRVTSQLPEHGRRQEWSHSWMADQLDLTPDQQQKMDAIWADTRQKIDKTFQRRRDMEKQRQQAVHELLTEQQRAAWEKINQDFQDQRDELFKERNAVIQDAEERSRALLSEDQQKKWDILSKQMRERHGQPGDHDRWPNNKSTTQPTGGAEGA
jgi:hypothetical protein